MAKSEIKPIRKDIPLSEIERRIKALEKSGRVLKRLFFIRYRYQGDSVEEAAQKVSVTKKLGYIWQDRWNTHGFPGLIPRFGGGGPPLLDEEQRNDLIASLKARNDWTTKEIRDLIKERCGIEYTMKHVRELLHGMGMKLGKPYPHDFRRPGDAEERLKKTDREE